MYLIQGSACKSSTNQNIIRKWPNLVCNLMNKIDFFLWNFEKELFWNDLFLGELTMEIVEVPSQIWNESHSMYSSLFSSVTLISEPPSFRSCCSTFPRTSKSAVKNNSNPHSSMLLSLITQKTLVNV